MTRETDFASNPQVLKTNVKNARNNLLLVFAFTLINIILSAVSSDLYFLFSAFIPYVLVTWGRMFCGLYPDEFYTEETASAKLLSPSFFAVFLGIALVFTALYLISWIFSKNKAGWLVFALVFFAVDTAAMFVILGFQLSSIIDILFHIWVLASLAWGIRANAKLKALPPEETAVPAPGLPETESSENGEAGEIREETADSEILRYADLDAKARIFLEADVLTYTVTYRRVKKVNELVIDGKVYAEFESLIEPAHSLSARIGGHLIEAGFDGVNHSFIKLDGQTVAKKLRLF
ncbi:MAG: hypothetical protein IJR89_08450 [Clostridia bacterium]|nr:hypothetical protein [Clostridia bacterium]